ncbi:uncharacterized protein LOC133906568 isoform X1 [Phragmites australis]|uniref:uncharacterized protein LOC133906568 isoform X1 n=1 Tax=Phragmites australis TaxID=29695 RepID=UPI002D790358|nr:uncharacterized protein LOC133906568 isoform X1 [Phragmites australis]
MPVLPLANARSSQCPERSSEPVNQRQAPAEKSPCSQLLFASLECPQAPSSLLARHGSPTSPSRTEAQQSNRRWRWELLRCLLDAVPQRDHPALKPSNRIDVSDGSCLRRSQHQPSGAPTSTSRPRSLCWLRLGDGEKALDDAVECKQLRPKRAKAYYRKGAALMLLKEYGSAYDTLYRGLELDPESEEMEKLFWEAMELK